jgi:hypothetical protein
MKLDIVNSKEHITQQEPELIPPEHINYFIDNSSTLNELQKQVATILF